MRAITSSILHCTACKSDLKIKVEHYTITEFSNSGYLDSQIPFYTKNSNFMLNDFIEEMSKFMTVNINVEDVIEIRNFMDSVVVIDGFLECVQCEAIYNVKDQIVDFYGDKIENKLK